MENDSILHLKKTLRSIKLLLAFNLLWTFAITILLAILLFSSHSANPTLQRDISYEKKFINITDTILESCCVIEDCGNQIISVWNNCIYEKKDDSTDPYTRRENGTGLFYEDFNDAINNLYQDTEFAEKLNDISLQQATIVTQMKQMRNPPQEWTDAYRELQDYYDEYMVFADMVLNCNGSLNSFSEEFSQSDTLLLRYYRKLILYYE